MDREAILGLPFDSHWGKWMGFEFTLWAVLQSILGHCFWKHRFDVEERLSCELPSILSRKCLSAKPTRIGFGVVFSQEPLLMETIFKERKEGKGEKCVN